MLVGGALCAAILLAGAACGSGNSSSPSPAASVSTAAATPSPVATRAALPVGERMVDIGGYKLAIRCQGQGAPTVIFETGAFPVTDEFGTEMSADIARERRVCTYDRAGTGKSEAGPNPRDGKQIAPELDKLLVNAHEVGPFVLVAWSVGALYTPLYATAQPDQVAGFVFIDPRLAAYQLEVGSDPRLTVAAAGLAPAYGEELRAWDSTANDVEAAGSLPDRPLVVLTAGSAEAIADGNTRKGGYDLWKSSQAALAASVPHGTQVVVDNASHKIWAANPQAVMDAIRTAAGG
jgi:pimeloyl-ACP methyl ester carboxylesterase